MLEPSGSITIHVTSAMALFYILYVIFFAGNRGFYHFLFLSLICGVLMLACLVTLHGFYDVVVIATRLGFNFFALPWPRFKLYADLGYGENKLLFMRTLRVVL